MPRFAPAGPPVGPAGPAGGPVAAFAAGRAVTAAGHAGASRAGMQPENSRRVVTESLAAVRAHLDMDVAFVGRFEHGRRWFDFVDADPGFCPVQAGDSDDLDDTYCARVVDGRIPGLIRDSAAEPGVRDLAVTHELPVGAHLSVPMVTADGVTLGTLCCFDRHPDPDLRDRDLQVLHMFAEVVSSHVEFLMAHERTNERTRERVLDVLASGGPAIALQPIVDLRTGTVRGYEALARFPTAVGWSPDAWFRKAASVGLGAALEASAVRAALDLLPRLPSGTSLAVNVSAEALCQGDVVDHIQGGDAARLIVELTEHTKVESYDLLADRLARLRAAGARVAVDDAGSGYSGLEHILQMRPEVLKLDRALVRGVDQHLARQAMIEAMSGFARRTGADLVAEGVETAAELGALRQLGVPYGQGYYLGRPSVPVQRS